MTDVRLPSLPTLSPAVRFVLRWAVSLGVFVVVALALRGRFSSVADTGVPWPTPTSIGLTVVLFVVANEIRVRAWLALVDLGHGHIDRQLGRWVWSKSQLARYAMAMAQVASRAVVARRHGMTASMGAITTLLEVVWYTCINGLLAAATIPWWLPETGLTWAAWFAVLPGLVIALAVVSPRSFVQLAVLASRLPVLNRIEQLGRAADVDITRQQTLHLTLLYTGNALVRLAGFLALYVGVGGSLDDILRVTGAFALGHLIGAVAVFAPGGLGPREGVTALALAPVIGGGPVLMLVGATRLFELVAELGYAAFARWRWSAYVEDHPDAADEDDMRVALADPG